jgi:hypothetical protein
VREKRGSYENLDYDYDYDYDYDNDNDNDYDNDNDNDSVNSAKPFAGKHPRASRARGVRIAHVLRNLPCHRRLPEPGFVPVRRRRLSGFKTKPKPTVNRRPPAPPSGTRPKPRTIVSA